MGLSSPFLARGLASKVVFMQRMGSAEGRSPFAGGTGVSPVFGLITPFLARKGDGGMVERVVEHQRRTSRAEALRQSRFGGLARGPHRP